MNGLDVMHGLPDIACPSAAFASPVFDAEIKKPRKIGDFFTGKGKVIIPGAGSDSKIKTSLPFVARQSIR